MKSFLNSRYLLLFVGILIAFQLLIVFSVVNYTCFFNSDTFYLPSVYQDVFYGYGWKGWQLNPAPNFFPDMITYFIIYFFSGENLSITSFVFAVIQYFFILFLLFKLIKKLVVLDNYNRNFVIGSLLCSLFLLDCVINNNFYGAFQLVVNSYHLGAFVNVLLAFILTLNYLSKRRKSTMFWLVLLILIASFSDKLFVVQYAAVVLFLLFFRISKEKKTSLKRIVILIISVLIPILIFSLMRTSDYLSFNSTPSRFTLEFVEHSFYKFFLHMQLWFSNSISEFVIAVVSCVSYLMVIVQVIKNRKKHNYFVLGIFFFLSFTLFTPILSGLYQGMDSVRYNITFYMVALFLFPFILDMLKVKQGFNNSFALIIPLACTVVIIVNINKMRGLEEYFNHKNTYAETLDELKMEYNLKNGIATYWSAKKNLIFSKKGVRVYSVFEDLKTYIHVTNRRWFRETKSGKKAVFNFVIIDKEKTLETVKNKFSNYKIIEKGEVKICITPDFIYPIGQNHLEILSPL